jgi:hypothetical protein
MKQAFIDIWQALVYVWNGAKKDPKRFAETPPEWWHSRAEKVPEQEDITVRGGGFAVGFDGSLIYSVGETKAEAKGWKEAGNAESGITENDYGEMLAHVPKLTNVALAKQIKPLWKQGKKYKEIAALVGCSEQYVKFYASAFSRAQKSEQTPTL